MDPLYHSIEVLVWVEEKKKKNWTQRERVRIFGEWGRDVSRWINKIEGDEREGEFSKIIFEKELVIFENSFWKRLVIFEN